MYGYRLKQKESERTLHGSRRELALLKIMRNSRSVNREIVEIAKNVLKNYSILRH